MNLVLYYDFNEEYREGKESVDVKVENFPFSVEISKEDLISTPMDTILENHRASALRNAAYSVMSEFGDVLAKEYY